MEAENKSNENELHDDVYLSKIPYIKIAFFSLIIISFAFFVNFPVDQKLKGIIAKSIKSNRACPMSYADLDLKLFFQPSLSFKNLLVKGRCLGKPRSLGIPFDKTDFVLKRPTVVPPGLLFKADATSGISDFNIFLTTGITSTQVRIEKSVIGSDLLAIPLSQYNIKLKGSIKADALIDSDYKNVTGGSFHLTSSDLSLPPQRIIILDIKGLRLSPLVLKGTMEDSVVKIHNFQIGNSTTKIEAIFKDGIIKLNKKNPRRHNVDLEGRIRFGSELLKEIPIIAPFLANAKMDDRGFYRLVLKGKSGQLKPKFR